LLTEGAGVPIGLAVDGANRHDMRMVRETITSIPIDRPEPTKRKPQGMCLDQGYAYDDVREVLAEFGFTAPIHSRGEKAKAIRKKAGFKARRWVCERTHSWFNRFRRILIRWEKKPQNYIGLLHLVCAIIAFRCAGLFG
jgi:transposase